MFVKVCGTTSEQDALLAVAMGADAVGFIFVPSPRQVAPGAVADIVKRLPPEIMTVGVFRDELPERIVDIARHVGLRAVQLHGSTTPEEGQWIRERVPFVLRAFPAGHRQLAKAARYGADVVFIDQDFERSAVFDQEVFDVPESVTIMLGGSLTPDNVAAAIAQVRPWGVDVIAGAESSVGVKDARKLRVFIAAARDASPPDLQQMSVRQQRSFDQFVFDDDLLAVEQEPRAPYDWQDES